MKGSLLWLGVAAALALGIFLIASGSAQALDEQNCLQCHGQLDMKRTTPQGRVVSIYVKASELGASVHRFIDCLQCHAQPHTAPAVPSKLSLADTCGSCHQYEARLHKESLHGQSLLRGVSEAASCVDCHSPTTSPHNVSHVLSPQSPAYRRNIAETCNRCHGDEKLMASYGLLEKTYETYMNSYHGKVLKLSGDDLKKLNMATCTNCHGVHDIAKTTDPSSPVASLTNLKEACAQCHPGADENFAQAFIGHKETSLKSYPAVYYTERGFLALTAGVVGGGLLITTLAFVHYTCRRPRGEGKE